MGESVLSNDVIVIKSFNNNIVLVIDNGIEKVLFRKGIGFGKKAGEIIRRGTLLEKVFVIENKYTQRNFNELVDKVDGKLIALVEEVLAELSMELEEELNENIHVALVDHLFYALKRLKDEEEIQNPFLVETEILYSMEFSIACKLAKRIKDEMNLDIPDGEIGFIALHLHSARNNGRLSNTIKYSFLGSTLIEHIEDRLEIEIDRMSLDYARFLTHIRFTVERILGSILIKNDLKDIIREKYNVSYKIAEESKEIICKILNIKDISEDEIAYLAMHIERFRVSIK